MLPNPIYVDTSAFYALMDRSDPNHLIAKAIWPNLLEDHICLRTSNYTVFESLNLIQYRLGYKAAYIWYRDILGVLDVYWVDQAMHRLAHELWMCLGRHQYTIVDCISYIVMNQNQIERVFSFKGTYAEQGFKLLSKTLDIELIG